MKLRTGYYGEFASAGLTAEQAIEKSSGGSRLW